MHIKFWRFRALEFRLIKSISTVVIIVFLNEIHSLSYQLHPKKPSVRPSRLGAPLAGPWKGAVLLLQPFGCDRKEKLEMNCLILQFYVIPFDRLESNWSQSRYSQVGVGVNKKSSAPKALLWILLYLLNCVPVTNSILNCPQRPPPVRPQAVAVLLRQDVRRVHEAVEVSAAAPVSRRLITI